MVAVVLLHDHLHCVWTLPPGFVDYSTVWRQVKDRFTTDYLAAGGVEAPVSPGKARKRERGVWQSRFWEHTVRDEDDLGRCLDYIHWNPVKHGYVTRPYDYPYSTFRKFVRLLVRPALGYRPSDRRRAGSGVGMKPRSGLS